MKHVFTYSWRAATRLLCLLLLASRSLLAQFCPIRNDYSVGDGTVSVAMGDINADGRLDIVAANERTMNITVLLAQPAGGYTTVNYDLGIAPNDVALGDVNGDGRLDIATANYDNDNVTVLLSQATGGYARTDYPVGDTPFSVALGDINADGRADIVTANADGNTVTVLLAQLTGDYAPTSYAVDNSPRDVALGDVNGDRRIDIVTANANGNTITALLGQATGGYTRIDYPVGFGPFSVALGDVNSDERLDIVTANAGNVTVTVLLSQPTGGYSPTTYAVDDDPYSVALGDVNADGLVDIITANFNNSSVTLLLGQATGGYARADYPVGEAPVRLVTGDVNADGRVDIVTANLNGDNVTVLLNSVPVSITRQPPSRLAVCTGQPVSVSVGTSGTVSTYQWYKGGEVLTDQTSSTLRLSNTTTANSGSYLVVITGCTSATSTAFDLTINPIPTVSVSPSATTVCQGQGATFSAQGANTYQWQGPNNFSSSANPLTVTATGTYSVTGTSAQGCLASATATLVVNPLPIISVSPSATTICQGQSATFAAQGTANTYQWRGPNGFTSSANPITVSTPGTYSVTSTNAQGCSASATATLTVNPLPSTPSLRTPTNQPGQLYPEGKNNTTLPQYAGNVTLIGDACPNGTIRWSGPNNTTGTGNITLPTNQTGTFVYQALCQVGQCTSAPTSATVTVVKDKLRVVAPLFDCATNQLTLRTTGGNGKTIEYHIASITNGWSSANPVTVSSKDFRRDFDIDARQKESDNTGYDHAQELDDYELPRCGGARLATWEELVEAPLSVTVLGNPVTGQTVEVEVRGAEGQPLSLGIVDTQGRLVSEQRVEQAVALEQRRLVLGGQAGLLLLRVSTPTQQRVVKLIRP